MSVNSVSSAGNAGGASLENGDVEKQPAKIKTTEEFNALMAKIKEDKAAGNEPAKEDMQSLLRYSISQSILATGRQIQQTAKDIERENIDKGF